MWSIGVDLRELFTDSGTLTPRFVWWLIEWLPQGDGALYAAKQGGPQHRAWSVDRHLSVTVMELLADANWQRGGGKDARPKKITRPKVKGNGARTVTVAQLNSGG